MLNGSFLSGLTVIRSTRQSYTIKKRLKGMWLSSTALTILWAEFAYEKAFRTLADLGRDAGGDRPYSKKNVQFFLAKIRKKIS